jgi:predicted nucleotidyltransferase
MSDLPLITLDRLVRALAERSIAYAIIGGVAVSLRSTPRYTEDVDAVLWVREEAWSELIEHFRAHGLTAKAADPIAFALFNRLLLLQDADGVSVDLSFGALPFEEELIRNAESIELADGLTAAIATAEFLVVMKAIAWRPKDIQDIREIVAINPGLDRAFVMERFAPYAELLEFPERVTELEHLLLG